MKLIPKKKVDGLRFGQLLICALLDAGYIRQVSSPHGEIAYCVEKTDLFYIENEDLEMLLKEFLAKHR